MPGFSSADEASDDLLSLVARQTGCDFTQYKPSTLSRRLAQRLRAVGCPDAASYRTYLEENPEEAARLRNHLLIGVTSFFRNPRSYESLWTEWAAGWAGRPPGPARIWVPACSTGEEAYSLAVRFREWADPLPEPPVLQLFATDVNPAAVDRARRGWFSEPSAQLLGDQVRRRWFDREGRGWRVKKELREGLTFAVHNLLTDPPFGHLDLVSCRNLFIYLEPAAQWRLTSSFAFALRPGGHLLLGTSESVDPARTWFDPVDKKAKLYRRRSMTPARLPVPSHSPVPPERSASMPIPPPPPRDLTVKELVLDLLAREYVVPSVLVDREGTIQFVWGDTSPVFRRRAGRPSDQLVENVVDSLQVAAANALAEAAENRRTVSCEGLRLPEPDGRPVRLTVRPVDAPVLAGPHFLAVFQVLEPAATRSPLPLSDRRTEDLERELNDTRLYLRSLVLKLEHANEELAAGNEEAQSMNEELQSSNEELESSREELQATNDELETVNASLASRVEELGRLHNDLANLMTSSRIAIIFLDRDQRLQRFSPEAGALLGLHQGDCGRPWVALGAGLPGPPLNGALERVLRELTTEEAEVSVRGRVFQVRMLPYRTTEDRIEGLVLTFHDLTDLRAAQKAGRKLDEQFQALFRNNPDAIVLGEAIRDGEGRVGDFRIERVNPAFAAWRGADADQMEGRLSSETSRGDSHQRLASIGRALDSGKPQSFLFESPATGMHLRTSTIPLGTDRFALLMEDITESVIQQQNLRASEALFRSTLTSMDDFVSVLDTEGRFAGFFQGHRRGDLFLMPEEFLGKAIEDLAIPEEAKTLQRKAFEAVKGGEPAAGWVYSLPYPGGPRWFSARLTPRLGPEGLFDGAVQVSRDITDQRTAEEALADREAQLRVVFEASPLGLMLLQDGVVVRANAAVHRMFGASELAGAPLERLLVREGVLQGIRQGGAAFPLKLDLAEVEPGVQVGVVQDLTERHRMERTVLNSQRLESLGILAGGIAHDFNNLLGGLFGFIQLARKATPEGSPAVRHLDRAFSAFDRAQDLTRQLLTFSKGGDPVKRAHDLRALLEESGRFILSGATLKLETDLPADLWPCEVDRHQVGQVIDNLGLNARQALPPGGTVRLSARNVPEGGALPPGLEPGPYVAVSFEDNGPGIPADILPRIFDPFFSTKKEGSGLGLATVESILRKHGGTVEVESPPGRGAVFRLWFPAMPEGLAQADRDNRRLLVIDDEVLILETALELLTDLGYEPVGVQDGAAAVDTFRRARRSGNRFGFVLTDLTLPGEKGGLAVLDQLRRIDPGLRAAASSGYSDDPVMSDPSAFGLEGFLPKPYTRDQLAAFLQAVFPIIPLR